MCEQTPDAKPVVERAIALISAARANLDGTLPSEDYTRLRDDIAAEPDLGLLLHCMALMNLELVKTKAGSEGVSVDDYLTALGAKVAGL